MIRKSNLKFLGKIFVFVFLLLMVGIAFEIAWSLNKRAMKVNQALVASNRPWLDEKTIREAYDILEKRNRQ